MKRASKERTRFLYAQQPQTHVSGNLLLRILQRLMQAGTLIQWPVALVARRSALFGFGEMALQYLRLAA